MVKMKQKNHQNRENQISAKPKRFFVEANTKSQSPKSSPSWVIKLMDRGWVTQPQVEYWVEYQILGEFLGIKVEFKLESGNKSLYIWVIVE